MKEKVEEGRVVECSSCGRKYVYNRKSGHGLSRCNSCVVNTRRFAIKEKAVTYKGGCCSRCGYKRSLRALQFHHRDPKMKEFGVSSMHCLSWERIKKELDKCDLLCSNCHAELHDEVDGGVAATGM
jgi:hypothetical protein